MNWLSFFKLPSRVAAVLAGMGMLGGVLSPASAEAGYRKAPEKYQDVDVRVLQNGPTLLFSDSPEMVYENGIYIFRARATNGAMVTFRSTEPIRVWDEENGSLGADKTGPGEELFTRLFEDRYTQVNYRGKTYYVLNPEDYSDTATTYTMTNVEVNPKLAQDCTKLPYQFANGDVDMTMGLALSSVWTTGMDELGGKTFVEYYNYLINDVADLGSVYQGKADTLTTTVESLENKRQEVIGVSSDEELSNLIRYQSAYNASSRFITVMSEMIETLVTQL